MNFQGTDKASYEKRRARVKALATRIGAPVDGRNLNHDILTVIERLAENQKELEDRITLLERNQ